MNGTCLDCGVGLKTDGAIRCRRCAMARIGGQHGATNMRRSGDLFRKRSCQTTKQKFAINKLCDELWRAKP